jgi:hypothetical protein
VYDGLFHTKTDLYLWISWIVHKRTRSTCKTMNVFRCMVLPLRVLYLIICVDSVHAPTFINYKTTILCKMDFFKWKLTYFYEYHEDFTYDLHQHSKEWMLFAMWSCVLQKFMRLNVSHPSIHKCHELSHAFINHRRQILCNMNFSKRKLTYFYEYHE